MSDWGQQTGQVWRHGGWGSCDLWPLTFNLYPTDPDLKTDGFGIDTCRSMVAVMDVLGLG